MSIFRIRKAEIGWWETRAINEIQWIKKEEKRSIKKGSIIIEVSRWHKTVIRPFIATITLNKKRKWIITSKIHSS